MVSPYIFKVLEDYEVDVSEGRFHPIKHALTWPKLKVLELKTK